MDAVKNNLEVLPSTPKEAKAIIQKISPEAVSFFDELLINFNLIENF